MSPSNDLVVRGGHVVDGTGEHGRPDVAVAHGTIASVSPAGADAATVLDAEGLVVLPGVVDSHVHLTDLGSGASGGFSPAHRRLAAAGVTTAVEFYDFATVLDQWEQSAAGLTVLGLQGLPAYGASTSAQRVRDDVAEAVRQGSIGVKLLGGHFPGTPRSAGWAIEAAADAGCYVAFHAGTTEHGSNLDGMVEALDVASGHPLHVAHTNAYLRGAVRDLMDENLQALALLREHPQVVSESHLAPLNICLGGVDGSEFTDHIVVNCLRLRGYDTDPAGLRAAFDDGFAHSLVDDGERAVPTSGDAGWRHWSADPAHTSLCFAVNRRLSAYLQACARVDAAGALAYEGPGRFVVDAISSDGGYWRNVILEQGLALVHHGSLTLSQLAHKTSAAPAALFGLRHKGRIAPGFDADLVGVDPATRRVAFTIAAGEVVFDGQTVMGRGGTVLTTSAGVDALQRRGIPCATLDLADSEFRRRAHGADQLV